MRHLVAPLGRLRHAKCPSSFHSDFSSRAGLLVCSAMFPASQVPNPSPPRRFPFYLGTAPGLWMRWGKEECFWRVSLSGGPGGRIAPAKLGWKICWKGRLGTAVYPKCGGFGGKTVQDGWSKVGRDDLSCADQDVAGRGRASAGSGSPKVLALVVSMGCEEGWLAFSC